MQDVILEVDKIEIAEIAFHVFDFHKLFEAFDQVAHTDAAFFHELGLSISAAIVVITA